LLRTALTGRQQNEAQRNNQTARTHGPTPGQNVMVVSALSVLWPLPSEQFCRAAADRFRPTAVFLAVNLVDPTPAAGIIAPDFPK
jgi:hypothetical protein